MSKYKILVGLTGSIACYKTCTILSELKKAGHEVQVVATPSALEFVGHATLEGLTDRTVLSDSFTPGHMMDHITLARWADIFLIAPLTANHINKMALGLADDFITTLYLAYESHKPLYLAPAMNTVMLAHPTVQEGLQKLQDRGARILHPNIGLLACGETGPGKMAEPESILESLFSSPRGKLLVTLGGTREKIDGVRSITNTSTGETGARLADGLARMGFEVTALCAESSLKPQATVATHLFTDHADLESKISLLLSQQRFDGVIHLAAVSDYRVVEIRTNIGILTPSTEVKLPSQQQLTLVLQPTEKIVDRIKEVSKNPEIKVVAFKLTNSRDSSVRELAIEKLLASPGVDAVVHNDLYDINKNTGRHTFNFYQKKNRHVPLASVSLLIDRLALFFDPANRFEAKGVSQPEVEHDFMS